MVISAAFSYGWCWMSREPAQPAVLDRRRTRATACCSSLWFGAMRLKESAVQRKPFETAPGRVDLAFMVPDRGQTLRAFAGHTISIPARQPQDENPVPPRCGMCLPLRRYAADGFACLRSRPCLNLPARPPLKRLYRPTFRFFWTVVAVSTGLRKRKEMRKDKRV